MMKPLTNFPWSLRWILRYVEWALISTGIIMIALNGELNKSSSLLKLIAFGVTFVLLSLILPIERPLWQRRVYVLVEMLLAVYASLMGELGFNSLVPFFLFKACLLLNLKEVLLTTLATITVHTIGFAWISPQLIAEIKVRRDAIPLPSYWQIVLGTCVSLIGACTLFVLLGLMFVAERKSRQRAEGLAQEVEVLAANLERTRIARDIHDSLGHALTTLDVQLELAQRLHHQEPTLSLKSLNTAKDLANQCLQDVRRALQTIQQPNFNLNEAIISLVEQVKQNQSFKVELELDLPQLPLKVSHQLYCIVQEGLTNILKHTHASWIVLRGNSTPDSVVLELADNGKGFDPELPHGRFGLRGMLQRVQGLGGELLIDTAPGQGTRIRVVIPK